MNGVVTGLLFLIDSAYSLLCEQQIEVPLRLIGGPENVTPTNKCVTSSKQEGRWVVVLLFIREAEGKI